MLKDYLIYCRSWTVHKTFKVDYQNCTCGCWDTIFKGKNNIFILGFFELKVLHCVSKKRFHLYTLYNSVKS